MHVLYILRDFATPNGSASTRGYEFARRWVQAGHRVTLLTTTARLITEDLVGVATKRLLTRLTIHGVDVVALKVCSPPHAGRIRHFAADFAFLIVGFWFAFRHAHVDLVYAAGNPWVPGLSLLLGRGLKGRRYVFEVGDVWPQPPIERAGHRFWMLGPRKLQQWVYRQSESVIVLSSSLGRLVREVAPSGLPVIQVPSFADSDLFRPEVDGFPVRRELGWAGRFVCVHSGGMDRSKGLDVVLRAAEHFRGDANFHFVLTGEGEQKARILAEKRIRHLENVEILNGNSKHKLPALLAAADLCLSTVAPHPSLESGSAEELFEYLSAGKPILLNYSGWRRELLESSRAGTGCRLGDDREFFAKLEALRSDPARCLEMPRKARKLAVERFDPDVLARKVLEVLCQVVASGARHGAKHAARTVPEPP